MYLDLANSKKVLISGCVLRRKESVKVHKKWFLSVPYISSCDLVMLEIHITLPFLTSPAAWPQKYNLLGQLSFLYSLGLFVNKNLPQI